MKNNFFLIGFILTVLFTQGQDIPDRWIIKLNNKALLATSQEDEKSHTIKLKSSDWKKNGFLEIIYRQAVPDQRKRSFLFFDEQENQLLVKDSVTSVKLTISTLRKLFTGKKQVRIYTIVYPLNPNIAINIRRVHLCTLQLP
jgi:hypothetical protein